jgi:hypothetical protein
MSTGPEDPIARLLAETGAAHGAYETTNLGGAYDEEWSGWYASYLLEHGLPDLLPHVDKIGVAQLRSVLVELDADYRREQPGGDWPAYYAERLGPMVEAFRPASGNGPATTA